MKHTEKADDLWQDAPIRPFPHARNTFPCLRWYSSGFSLIWMRIAMTVFFSGCRPDSIQRRPVQTIIPAPRYSSPALQLLHTHIAARSLAFLPVARPQPRKFAFTHTRKISSSCHYCHLCRPGRSKPHPPAHLARNSRV